MKVHYQFPNGAIACGMFPAKEKLNENQIISSEQITCKRCRKTHHFYYMSRGIRDREG